MSTQEILLQRTGRLGHIVLNRPKAINALNDSMITAVTAALREWAEDDAVETVLISGAGERGLCAGGDIVAIYRHMKDGGDEIFWEDEYRMNSLISRYPKPIVAFMDGVVLGGGIGISAHASHRVVTERTRVGMPETRIGFIPDVGGCFLYSRAPGELGTHLALTAGTGTGADAIALGLADYLVDSAELPALAAALAEAPAQEAMAAFSHTDVPASDLEKERGWIDECYAFDDAEQILAALKESPEQAAQAAAEEIEAKSPTAVKLTLEALRRAGKMETLEEVLDQDYRLGVRLVAAPDFAEGVRAQVIDKDRNPAWNPATLAEVDRATVESYFADLGEHELGLAASVQAEPAAGN
ncbi:enoyl-CoA hydratase/isomerase family protein [Arthrobacter sulfonylureivorans]|uniref:3-hydroxyisobutyryl-CoA hydrolase n=1 Tax=Arthrobacter sulfonylureivorans TaxID=2486855 RepID=A0ABY3W4U4_9MICC|nr:enoyl-CoA hydratase/isomerase family protein [Arthrobacter sulfonylureivorans]UNK45255.1 enoyl-CoA hydratase/isomerase family protein [Arthrobacter sulfonylureivorans]